MCAWVSAVAVSAELPTAIEAVEGTDVRIPCPQFRQIERPHRIRLVLWFKDNDTNPIARFVVASQTARDSGENCL